MTRTFVLLLGTCLAACSSDKPPETAYDANEYDSSEYGTAPAPASEPVLAPASSDAAGTGARDRRQNADALPSERSGETRAGEVGAPAGGAVPADNTDRNERDRDPAAVTAGDQGENSSDLAVTQRIRQALMDDGSLSFAAKNVKVITQNGRVTLRGTVRSAQERTNVEAAARRIAGATNVDSQLEIAK